MDRVGNALKPYTQVGSAEREGVKILGCYHAGWKHNFVVVAPDSTTTTDTSVVMFDGWALAFGVASVQC